MWSQLPPARHTSLKADDSLRHRGKHRAQPLPTDPDDAAEGPALVPEPAMSHLRCRACEKPLSRLLDHMSDGAGLNYYHCDGCRYIWQQRRATPK